MADSAVGKGSPEAEAPWRTPTPGGVASTFLALKRMSFDVKFEYDSRSLSFFLGTIPDTIASFT